MVVAEIYPLLRRLRFVHDAITEVMASFTGLLASMVITLGRPVIGVPATLGLVIGAFVAVRTLRWNALFVFVVGLTVWGFYLAAGIAGS